MKKKESGGMNEWLIGLMVLFVIFLVFIQVCDIQKKGVEECLQKTNNSEKCLVLVNEVIQ